MTERRNPQILLPRAVGVMMEKADKLQGDSVASREIVGRLKALMIEQSLPSSFQFSFKLLSARKSHSTG